MSQHQQFLYDPCTMSQHQLSYNPCLDPFSLDGPHKDYSVYSNSMHSNDCTAQSLLSNYFDPQSYDTTSVNHSGQHEPSFSSGYTAECDSSISSHPSTHYSGSQRPTVHIKLPVFQGYPMSATSTPPSSAFPETPQSSVGTSNGGRTYFAPGPGYEHCSIDPPYPALTSESLPEFQAGLVSASFNKGFDGRTAPFKDIVASSSVREIAEKKRKKEAIYKCSFCPATFTAKHNRKYHENSHIGLKDFPCSLCGMEFGHNRSRARHQEKSCPRRPRDRV